METKISQDDKETRAYRMEKGTLYFTKKLEQRIFLIMTMVMLAAGALAYAGIF